MKSKILLSLLFIAILFSCKDEDTFKTDIADFGKLKLEENSYWKGKDGTNCFSSGNKIFNNTYFKASDSWNGFVYSNVLNIYYYNDESRYAAYADVLKEESGNYAVAHQYDKLTVDMHEGEELRSVQVANCTYTALSILNAYGKTKKFGGESGDDPDWLKLSIKGIGLKGQVTGELEVFLADFRYENNAQDYVLDSWKNVDLRSLGIVKQIELQISSSDKNTPLYFCVDNLKGRIHY